MDKNKQTRGWGVGGGGVELEMGEGGCSHFFPHGINISAKSAFHIMHLFTTSGKQAFSKISIFFHQASLQRKEHLSFQ